jgi:hypothetical protein
MFPMFAVTGDICEAGADGITTCCWDGAPMRDSCGSMESNHMDHIRAVGQLFSASWIGGGAGLGLVGAGAGLGVCGIGLGSRSPATTEH